MKFTSFISYADIVAWMNSMLKITSVRTANNNNGTSINPYVNSDTLSSYSRNVNSLKSFDTAFIAYQMMGLSNFDERKF